MKNRNPQRSSILLAGPTISTIAAFFLAVSMVIFYGVVPYVKRTLILRETKLEIGSETWDKWVNVKHSMFIKFHFFNVTNLQEAEKGAKFKVQDVGPYVWEEKRTKEIVAFDDEEDTVTYKEVVYYYFRQDLSVGSQEDTVNIVNVPFLAAGTLIYKLLYSDVANYVIDFFVTVGEKFVMRNVNIRELVFDGVDLGSTYDILGNFGIIELPEEFNDGTFAFYNRRNGTPTKEYKVYRGIKNYEDFGKIAEYDHQKELKYWTNQSLPAEAQQYCNKINGSDGSLVAPFVTKDRRLQFFSHEICRSVTLKFEEEIRFKGIEAYRFNLPETLLAAPDSNEDNRCFCTDPGSGLENYCDGAGVIRIFPCKKNAPIGLSLPHFLKASQRYHEGVDGLEPDVGKHEIVMIVEPNTGTVLQIVKRVQIVTEMQRFPGINAFANVTYAVVPIFWAEELVDSDDKQIAEFRDRLVWPLELLKIVQPTVLGFLVCALASGIFMSVFYKQSSKPLMECLPK